MVTLGWLTICPPLRSRNLLFLVHSYTQFPEGKPARQSSLEAYPLTELSHHRGVRPWPKVYKERQGMVLALSSAVNLPLAP